MGQSYVASHTGHRVAVSVLMNQTLCELLGTPWPPCSGTLLSVDGGILGVCGYVTFLYEHMDSQACMIGSDVAGGDME